MRSRRENELRSPVQRGLDPHTTIVVVHILEYTHTHYIVVSSMLPFKYMYVLSMHTRSKYSNLNRRSGDQIRRYLLKLT